MKTEQSSAEPEQQVPWRVFTDVAPVFAEPVENGSGVEQFAHGTEIHGRYFVHPQTDEEWLGIARDEQELWIPRTRLCRIHPDNLRPGNLPAGEEKVDRWWGLPLEYEPTDLINLPRAWGIERERDYPLRADAMDALVEMLEAAQKEGVEIRVNSAYRSGEYQRGLYERAVARDGAAQRYSAPPGHSEHQLGTCVDLTDPEEAHAFTEGFGKTEQGRWLAANAGRFGFRRSYFPENTKETGYISEPWHWRWHGRP